jgi:hypothetical protein
MALMEKCLFGVQSKASFGVISLCLTIPPTLLPFSSEQTGVSPR